MGAGAVASGPILLHNDLLCPLGGLLLPLPETFACRYCCALPARYNGHRAALEGEFTVSEQANYGVAHAFGARLLSYADNAALPVDVHDFSDAINRCLLVDKTMFIADILDSEAPVALCCRPKGFGKSMNLSMLRAFLERPAVGRSGQRLFADAQIWDANGGRYRDEYACYPVISLDFSGAARRGPAVADVVRDALSGECARLLALLEAPDLARDKVRHIERVARGVASADEVDSVLGVLIELLEIACDEQVVLLVDGYDAAWSRRASARNASDADPAELLDRVAV